MIQTAEGYNFPAGIGYIALPVDLTREAYISLCYKTCTVSLRTDDGGFFNRCPISESDLNSIDFPEDINKLGSAVVFVNEPIKNQLLVVALYPSIDEVQDGKEGQFKIKRKVSDSYVEISGSGKDRFIGISVVSLTDKPSEFYVRVSNKKQNSKLKLEVTGDIEVLSTKNTKLVAFDSTTIETKNSSDKNKLSQFKQTSQENHFEAERFTIDKGDQAMIRGNKMKDLFSSFFDDLSKAMVQTVDGPAPLMPDSITLIQSYKAKLEDLLSTKSFLE